MDHKLVWSLFIGHAVLCVAISFSLMLLNLFGDFRHPWFLLVWVFWGSLVFGHYRLNKLILSGYFQKLQENLIEKLEK